MCERKKREEKREKREKRERRERESPGAQHSKKTRRRRNAPAHARPATWHTYIRQIRFSPRTTTSALRSFENGFSSPLAIRRSSLARLDG